LAEAGTRIGAGGAGSLADADAVPGSDRAPALHAVMAHADVGARNLAQVVHRERERPCAEALDLQAPIVGHLGHAVSDVVDGKRLGRRERALRLLAGKLAPPEQQTLRAIVPALHRAEESLVRAM